MVLDKDKSSNKFLDLILKSPELIAIKNGLIFLIPVLMIGSLTVLINNFPIPAYKSFMLSVFGPGWKNYGEIVWQFTFGIMGLYLTASIAFALTREKIVDDYSNINAYIISTVAVIVFFITTYDSAKGISFDDIGYSSLFIAIAVAIISSFLFVKLKTLKFLKLKLGSSMHGNLIVNESILAIIPSVIVLLVFVILKVIFVNEYGTGSINNFINESILYLFSNLGALTASFVYVLLNQIMWFLGIHGGNMLRSVVEQFGTNGGMALSKQLFDVFVWYGGTGATLCVLMTVLCTKRENSAKRIAMLALIPSLFNINEIILFGLPIVFNPLFFIPFLIVPIVLTILTYIAVFFNFIPYEIFAIEWTTPVLISGYLATKSFNGVLFQLICVIVGTLIYVPFVGHYNMESKKKIREMLGQLYSYLSSEGTAGMQHTFMKLNHLTSFTSQLSYELEDAIKKNKGLYLVYQPKHDSKKRIVGFEALLRWEHSDIGEIVPMSIVAIAENFNLMNKMGLYVIDKCCTQIVEWSKDPEIDFKYPIAINVSPTQLKDESFNKKVISILEKHEIATNMIEIEITESMAFDIEDEHISNISALQNHGIKIAIDDFGMGHTSVYAIRKLEIDSIKIDGSLTKDVVDNYISKSIILSIVNLCESLNIEVVAEYVENEVQRKVLVDLGCHSFQGHFFSKPLMKEDVKGYLEGSNL